MTRSRPIPLGSELMGVPVIVREDVRVDSADRRGEPYRYVTVRHQHVIGGPRSVHRGMSRAAHRALLQSDPRTRGLAAARHVTMDFTGLDSAQLLASLYGEPR